MLPTHRLTGGAAPLLSPFQQGKKKGSSSAFGGWSSGPRIRTPGTLDSPPPQQRRGLFNMASYSVPRPRLPRSLSRVGALLLVSVVLLYILGSGGDRLPSGEGWDATSVGDRRNGIGGSSLENGAGGGNGGAMGILRSVFNFKPSKPSWLQDASQKSIVYSPHGPNLSRFNRTAPRRTGSRGVSRTVIKGSIPEAYEERPLPTIEEAMEHLRPRMIQVKEDVPAVPREHQLWSPMFQPFLTKDQQDRFRHLRAEWDPKAKKWIEVERRWFISTVCRQVAGMLGDWFAMWTVLADFLGPETLFISLLEGGSDDGSGEILSAVMRDHLLFIGVPPSNIYIRTMLPPIEWEGHHRIELLADMRNAGMKPFYDTVETGLSPDGKPWTGIIQHNDVYLSGLHVLELMHQHVSQGADMSCGWDHAGKWFYDGWVGRDMSGDLFSPFPVPEEQEALPAKFFVSHPPTLERHLRTLPYQVFAAWNGIAIMRPDPFYPPYNVRFRRAQSTGRGPDVDHRIILPPEIECQQSESSFISWDFWKYGFGRVMVVPGIHACYGKDDARVRGWVEFPKPDEQYSEMVDWEDEPPRKVRCHDWPDKPGKGWWAWDTVRWVDPPALVIPEGETAAPSHASQGDSETAKPSEQAVQTEEASADMGALFQGSHDDD